MITTSHSEQKPRVMRKTVRQSVNGGLRWQPDPEETATNVWIAHYATNLIQGFQRHFGIHVQKPENIAIGGISSEIHLPGTAPVAASNYPVAEALCQLVSAICAAAIDHNHFRPAGSLSQVRKEWPYQHRLIKGGNDNGDAHFRFNLAFSLRENV